VLTGQANGAERPVRLQNIPTGQTLLDDSPVALQNEPAEHEYAVVKLLVLQ
jgi:hypothetical protein